MGVALAAEADDIIPYSQYTDELGAAHGEFTLSREYIESMLRSTIDEEFLTLD